MKSCVRWFMFLGLTACVGGTLAVVEPGATDGTAPTTSTTGSNGVVSEVSHRFHDEVVSLVYVEWDQAQAMTGFVEFSFDEGEWWSSPPQTFEAGPAEQILLGIPYDIDFTYRVVMETAGGQVATEDYIGKTARLSGLSLPDLLASDSERYEPSGRFLMASINKQSGGWTGGEYWKFIADRQGRLVWAMQTPNNHWTIYMRVSYDGTSILWDEQTYWSDWDGGQGSQVHRMKIDGTIEESYSVPGQHHVYTQLADGSIVWGAANDPSETLERRYPDGTQERIWDCEEWMDDIDVNESCQSNTLYWHEPTDTFLFSFYTTSTAVEIDHATGATLRQWGQLHRSWDFDPPDSIFQWQHGLNYTDEGTLLLSTEVPLGDWESETAAREYIVDDDTETLVEIWNYGLGRGVYANTAGEAHRLANGNTLHNYGSDGSVREVTPEGDIVWGMEWSGDKLLGRSVFIEDLYVFAP
jgi:hypothetical protein